MRRLGISLAIVACSACALAAGDQPPDALAQPGATLAVRLGEAVLMALTNNRALAVQRLSPEIQQTFEDLERAAFDPVVTTAVARERSRPPPATSTTADAGAIETITGSLGVSQRLPTGTTLGATLTGGQFVDGNPEFDSGAGLALNQALLQGRPVAVNLVNLRQARLDTDISAYELRGFAEMLVADVERGYWECALALRRVEILEQSRELAERQLREIEQRVKVGSQPETELAAAQAEVALRQESLINARSGLATVRLRLLRLMAPDALQGARTGLRLMTDPASPDIELGAVEAHVAMALMRRPDLNQARLQLQGGDLELVKTRNGLLPRLDIFVRLGDTGYAAAFGNSLRDIDGRELDVAAGVMLELPVRNREARAIHRRAQYSREQLGESLRNLEDLVRVDVESACIEVDRARAQVAATATTRRFQEEKLRVETVKFNVGRSTSLLVAATQRDLVSSQVSEVEAVIRHLQALVDLYRLEGSLLERRGVIAPGRQPTINSP